MRHYHSLSPRGSHRDSPRPVPGGGKPPSATHDELFTHVTFQQQSPRRSPRGGDFSPRGARSRTAPEEFVPLGGLVAAEQPTTVLAAEQPAAAAAGERRQASPGSGKASVPSPLPSPYGTLNRPLEPEAKIAMSEWPFYRS